MTAVNTPNMVSDRLSEESTILLLGGDTMSKELLPQLDKLPVNVVDAPYEALEELSRSRRDDRPDYEAIILTAPREEFAGLARAVRRLCGSAKLLAFARSDDQDSLREDSDSVIDRVCLFPPTRSDLSSLVREFGPAGATDEPLAALTAIELEQLILATHNLPAIESAVIDLFEARNIRVRWEDTNDIGNATVLIKSPADPTRSLVLPNGEELSSDADALIDNIYQMLPSLMRVSSRCESLHRLAITDHLTGAYNRRYFYHLTNQVLGRSAASMDDPDASFRATLLLYDIDNFKQYNDEYGHAAGDDILRDTARLMKQVCREQDIVARIGGDEFAVLFWDNEPRMPGSQPLQDILALADRFREAVSRHHFPALGPAANGVLTISGGLASFPAHGASCLELLQQADHALREAKQAGKNIIRLVGED